MKEFFENTSLGNAELTESMRNYEPVEMFATFGTADPMRLIFSDTETWTEKEKTSIKMFKVWCNDNSLKVPSDDVQVLRFLQNKQFNYSKAHAALVGKTAMMAQYLPGQVTEKVKNVLESGCFYLSGRDKCYRPIITINAAKIFSFKPALSVDELIAAQALLFFLIEKRMLIPGKIENVLFLCDMSGAGVFGINYTLLKGIVNYVQ